MRYDKGMKVTIAGDHFTVDAVNELLTIFASNGIEAENVGTTSKDEEVSLPEIIPRVARKVQSGEVDFGVLACGTGVGVEIGANRFKGVRASLCRDAAQAKNARVYDNANVLCVGSWYNDELTEIVEAWLDNQFDGDPDRLKMIKDFDTFAEE